jgi:Flp pilus assembly protein TadD
VLLCAIYRREDKEHTLKAVPLLRELIAAFPRNHLFYLELVQLYSDLEEEANVVSVFKEMDKRLASAPDFFHAMPPARFAFAKGTFQFWYRYYPEALENMKVAVAGSETMDLHTDVLAHMRLGQIYDQLGQREAARKAYEAAIAQAPESDVARESRGYLRRPYHREDLP